MNKNMQYVFACLVGNILEWYDFILYGIFSGMIAVTFFPPQKSGSALIETFLTLALGYFVRPLGGVLFGHFGDSWSRRKTLVCSLLLMGVTTTFIGFLPGYASWGIISTILLVLLRVLQGLAVGGEFPGTMVFLVENAPSRYRAFVSSFAFVGAMGGVLLATLVAGIFSAHWRIPFIMGMLLGFIGLYLRIKFIQKGLLKVEQQKDIPVFILFRQYGGSLLKAFGYLLMPAVFTGITTVYAVSYFTNYYHFSLQTAIHVELLGSVLTLIFLPISAYLADCIGQYRSWLLVGLLLLIILVGPLFLLMQQGFWGCIIGFSLFIILSSMAMGPEIIFITSLFRKTERYSGVGLAHGLAFSLIVGTAPLVLNYCAEHFGSMGPSAYMVLAALIALISVSCSSIPLVNEGTSY